MRPKNSKDITKRKNKKFLSVNQELSIISEYVDGLSFNDLSKKYNVSKSCISSLFKRRNIKPKVNPADLKMWQRIECLDDMEDGICGIYGVYFINKKNTNDIKLYIGSSINIRSRLKEHIRELDKKHDRSNKYLLNYYNNNSYNMNMAIIEHCVPDSLLEQETKYQKQFNKCCLLNTWIPTKAHELLPWLEKAVTLGSYKKHIKNADGCWESKSIHKSGYARLCVIISGVTKYFYSHRVAYWEKYHEYPELVRHKCGNSKCKNPDHLEKGNHRDNAIDKRGNFPIIFEQKWLEFDGDPVRLSHYFSDRWKLGQEWQNTKISNSIYSWEKKLDLRKKYPEVLDSNKSRRFSLSYQKLGRSKKKIGLTR